MRSGKARDCDVVIDQNTGTVTVDGDEFPWLIASDGPQISVEMGVTMVRLPVLIFGGNVTVIPKAHAEKMETAK